MTRFNISKLLYSYFLLTLAVSVQAQGTFESAQSGNWNAASTWTLVSGTDADGKPDADDDVTIKSGHQVNMTSNSSCNNLEMAGGKINYNQDRSLTVNGELSTTLSSEFSGFSNNHILQVDGDFSVNADKTLTMGAIRFTVSGQTYLKGHLEVSGFGQTRSFKDIDIQTGGKLSFSGQDQFTINGNLHNDGTFEANGSNQTFQFTSSNGSISGSSSMSFYAITFNSPAAYTNTGHIIVRETMSGSGSFTNGNGAQLELQNDGPFTVGSFDASATGNLVTYTGFGNLQPFESTYYNLLCDKSSGTLSLTGNLTINNRIGVSNGILKAAATNLSIRNDLIIFGGEFTADDDNAVVKINDDILMSSGSYDHNRGTVSALGILDATGGSFFMEGSNSELSVNDAYFRVPMTMNSGKITTQGDFILYPGSVMNNAKTNFDIGDFFALGGVDAQVTGGTLEAGNIYTSPNDTLEVTAAQLYTDGFVLMDGAIRFTSSNGSGNFGHIFIRSSGLWEVTQAVNFTVRGNLRTNGLFKGDPGFGNSTYTLSSSSGGFRGSGTFEVRSLKIDNPAHYTNFARLIVSQSINGNGSFTNGAGSSLTYKGNNSGGSNFDIANFDASARNNTVIYAGPNHSQRWKPTIKADNDYFNVTLRTGTGDYQRLQLVEDIKVNGELSILEGDIVLNQYNLTLGTEATISGADHDDYIRINNSGKVRFEIDQLNTDLFVPIGDNNDNYSPVQKFKLTSGNLGNNARVDFTLTTQAHPNRDTANENQGGDDTGTAAVDYLKRFWTVSGHDITDPQYDMVYKYVQDDVVGTESNMVGTLYQTVPSLGIKDWHKRGIVNPVDNTVTLTEADNFGDAYAMDDNLSRLPIELISFDAAPFDQEVYITWATASETDNAFFTIERSANGLDFEIVATKPGAGNSTKVLNYQFTDEQPLNGRSYYRLKQTDFSGEFEYSELRSVYMEIVKGTTDLSVYPNPVATGGTLTIKTNHLAAGQLELKNMSGRTIQAISLYNQSSVKIETQGINPGLYVLRVTNSSTGGTETRRLLIQ